MAGVFGRSMCGGVCMAVADTLCHTSEKLPEIKSGVGSGVHWHWLEHVIAETGKAALKVTAMSEKGIRAAVSKCTSLREVPRLVSPANHFGVCPFPLPAAELSCAHQLMTLWLVQSSIKV